MYLSHEYGDKLMTSPVRWASYLWPIGAASIACAGLFSADSAAAQCEAVKVNEPELELSSDVLKVIGSSNLTRADIFTTLRIVARYETNGCWGAPTGDFDGQLVSVGVMQWNFGQGSLQPLLKRFREKFSSHEHFEKVRDELMPLYGQQMFDISCRTSRVGDKCRNFLKSKMSGPSQALSPDLRAELEKLFNHQVMRQIQLDYFSRSVTSVLSDLERVFENKAPAAWQVAWAVDMKTQQGNKFPTDKNIAKIRLESVALPVEERKKKLSGVVKWYEGLCDSGFSEGIRHDCAYNVKTWPTLVDKALEEVARERTVHLTFLVARTAQTNNGAYQANAFQRRAAIAFGRGSVHRTVHDFLSP